MRERKKEVKKFSSLFFSLSLFNEKHFFSSKADTQHNSYKLYRHLLHTSHHRVEDKKREKRKEKEKGGKGVVSLWTLLLPKNDLNASRALRLRDEFELKKRQYFSTPKRRRRRRL